MEDILDFKDEHDNVESRQLAGFWERVGASVIDSLVMIPVAAFGAYNLIGLKSVPIAIIVFLLNAIYKIGMESLNGATIGKMALGLEVVDAQNSYITLEQSMLRYCFYFIQGFWGMLGGIKLMQSEMFSEVVDFDSYIAFSQSPAAQSQGSWIDIVM